MVERAESLIRRLLATGGVKERELRGCSEADITRLEKKYGVQLPEAYKVFLRRMAAAREGSSRKPTSTPSTTTWTSSTPRRSRS